MISTNPHSTVQFLAFQYQRGEDLLDVVNFGFELGLVGDRKEEEGRMVEGGGRRSDDLVLVLFQHYGDGIKWCYI